ncbi:oligopeptide:H+ symporter [uncultured Endozoicomonas sp.]|uniref:oligopeptide:H+ symporter n=1 Tax=uncultured Endozoicomonas sp. TaxID=432652 RepID=UPI002605B1E3|nr:oligopeptide:H+ symporter [uncultured Endozoicomonas sp.]
MSQSFNILKQPKPFYLIFFIELWERFGYYGLQALLSLYLVQSLGLDEDDAFITFGAFSALVFGFVSVGGFIGDNLFGAKRTMVLGALVMMAGYLMMAFSKNDQSIVYLALGVIAVGNGLFKANPASLLAKCYAEGDSRLDGAFTLYYMSINIGSFISMTMVPYIADYFGWGMGFLASAIGLFIAVSNYFLMRHCVSDYGSKPDFSPVSLKIHVLLYAAIIIACACSALVLNYLMMANILLAVVGTGALIKFIKEILVAKEHDRRKMIVVLVLMLEAVVFYVMYMQMPTTLNFFAIQNVQPVLLGITINPVTFQSLNPFWIMVVSPIFAWLYNRTEQDGHGLSMPGKFALGMLCTSLSFLILPIAAKFADDLGVVSSSWLVLSYLFQAMGELLISGLGLAMIAQLVPSRLHGFIMGIWFLTSSAASVIAGHVAGMTVLDDDEVLTALDTLPIYSDFFTRMGVISLGVAILMMLFARKLHRMIVSS